VSEDEYLRNVIARNADLFAAEKVKLTSGELERLLRVAYRAGQQDRSSPPAADGGDYSSTKDLFKQFFG
jgi:hypothetical protein